MPTNACIIGKHNVRCSAIRLLALLLISIDH